MKDFLVAYAPTIFGVIAGLLSGFFSIAFFRWLDRRGKIRICFLPVWDDEGIHFQGPYPSDALGLLTVPLRLEFFNTSLREKTVGNFNVYLCNKREKIFRRMTQVRYADDDSKRHKISDGSRFLERVYSLSIPSSSMREVSMEFSCYLQGIPEERIEFDICFSFVDERGYLRVGKIASAVLTGNHLEYDFEYSYHELLHKRILTKKSDGEEESRKNSCNA